MGRLRPSTFRRRKVPLPFWVVLILAGLALFRSYRTEWNASSPPLVSGSTAFVERVVDGDTLLLADSRRVRLIGVDTPETKHPTRPVEPFGPEASAFTTEHAEHKEVRLEFDKEREDRYHRTLAYVYVGDWFLNEELIRAGFSRAVTKYPFSQAMKRRFLAAEEEARRNHVGIWGSQALQQSADSERTSVEPYRRNK